MSLQTISVLVLSVPMSLSFCPIDFPVHVPFRNISIYFI